ncbi:DUF2238 domain-containing protein [Planctomicrobium sp. SH664]|uniref:DUF2238 domain-containing protein n=1 Tax=Planctomicrobium sp. SH664 TaxID=3448125 RepID=UPI003F5BFDDD
MNFSSMTHNRKRPLIAFSKSDWAAALFTVAYILPAFVISLQRGNSEFLIYVAVLVIVLTLVTLLHLQVRLHPLSLWGLSLWGLLHMLGGLATIPSKWTVSAGADPVLYNWWLIPGRLKFDQVVHAYGFGLTTWICWQGLQRALANRGVDLSPSPGLVLLCIMAGMGFGAFNEVIEFIATVILPETNVGGYENTGWDLVANLVGSLVAGVAILARGSARVSRSEAADG